MSDQDWRSIQAKDGRWWHGPEKDEGRTWGDAVEAWVLESPKAAQRALEGLSGPSAEEAKITAPPWAALLGGLPADATDGELEVAAENTVRPGRRVKLRRPRSSR